MLRFIAHAVPQAEFDRWVEATRGGGPVLDRAAYAQLAKQSVPDRPSTYRAVAPDLFMAVATQQIPPAPGPRHGRAGRE